ncbi:ficolin-3-like [Acanthaster planci]|uniref:Ficolin-3-like n=1 Tax=Acanthaster planci TaxID=133434 RepID=A0A8B7YT97_ACAPL|nr:ficolin-3-like [Acanthaster planci]
MDAAGKGWIVFQRRFDGSVNFNRNWTEYRDGFGDLTGEFWLGNEKLRQLTSQKEWLLQTDLKFTGTNGHTKLLYRWPFRVEGDNYNLVKGSIGNSPLPTSQLPCQFSTYDKDNDGDYYHNCAASSTGGWWVNQCHSKLDLLTNLNGAYALPEESSNFDHRGFTWSYNGSVETTGQVWRSEMRLRRFRPYGKSL